MTRGLGDFQEGQANRSRNAQILELVDQSPPLSYEQIAARFGLTKQRIAQIVRRERRRLAAA